MTRSVGWIDASGGVSGDMLLGACIDSGVDPALVQEQIDRLGLPEKVTVTATRTRRGGLAATKAVVSTERSTVQRTLPDVLSLLEGAVEPVAAQAGAVFRALARAEAAAHGVPLDEVHFHEVGALDAIADIVGVVTAVQSLGLSRLVCSPIALGGGRVRGAHGPIPIPGPAVLELLRSHDAPAFGGPVQSELATPTGVALMVTLADAFGPLPHLRPERIGTGAGTQDPADHVNVTRLVVGSAVDSPGHPADGAAPSVVLEANVDDLDPRLWPAVLTTLMAAGAADAWLTPILMKKGRPAHTLSVLTTASKAERLERIVFEHTSTIGLRRVAVDRRALEREEVAVDVSGERVRVKLARLDGHVVSATPEYDDVAQAAEELGTSPKRVLSRAQRAAAELLDFEP